VKIGIVGAGNIGGTMAELLVGAGHEVALSNSRGPDSLRGQTAALGPQAHAMTVDDAASFGDVVLLALPWRNPEGLPDPERVRGKIVIDATNHYTLDGGLFDLGDSTSSEEVLKRLPGARLVKAFNTIYWKHLARDGRTGLPLPERRAIFVAGDDADAKAVVSRLIEEIGFAPVDTGTLLEGGLRQQPGAPVYDVEITAREAEALLAS
jgi:predicted dinucleotide-binding enzyme